MAPIEAKGTCTLQVLPADLDVRSAEVPLPPVSDGGVDVNTSGWHFGLGWYRPPKFFHSGGVENRSITSESSSASTECGALGGIT